MKIFLRIVLGVALAGMAILVWNDERSAYHPSAVADESVGQAAAAFSLPRASGAGDVALSDHAGDVVVLDFWALYCRPCIESMPHLQRLHEEFEADGVRVISVNVDVPEDDRAARVAAFAERNGLTFDVLLDRGTVGWTYGARRIPYVVVVGRDGRIHAVHRGGNTSYAALRGSVRSALEAS